jgi:hypothetical protein
MTPTVPEGRTVVMSGVTYLGYVIGRMGGDRSPQWMIVEKWPFLYRKRCVST